MSIPRPVYEQIRQRAQYRCEYCHYPELLSTAPLSSDPYLTQNRRPQIRDNEPT